MDQVGGKNQAARHDRAWADLRRDYQVSECLKNQMIVVQDDINTAKDQDNKSTRDEYAVN